MKYRSDDEYKWGVKFGSNLKNRIAVASHTQAELADKIGVSRQIMSRYIQGDAIPSVYKACQIANVLGCSLDDLLNT